MCCKSCYKLSEYCGSGQVQRWTCSVLCRLLALLWWWRMVDWPLVERLWSQEPGLDLKRKEEVS